MNSVSTETMITAPGDHVTCWSTGYAAAEISIGVEITALVDGAKTYDYIHVHESGAITRHRGPTGDHATDPMIP